MTNSTPTPNRKPTPRGGWHGPSAWKLAGKRCVALLVTSILFFVGVMLLSFDIFWVKCVVLALFVGGGFYYHLRSGESDGERDCAWAEGVVDRYPEGESIPPAELDRCFHPLKGLFAVLISLIPFLIPCILLAILTKRQEYTLVALPAWAQDLLDIAEFRDELSYYTVQEGTSFVQILRVVVRSILLPYFNVATALGNDVLLNVERVTPLLMLIVPTGYAIGYANGQKLRDRVNESIRLGVEKKIKKQKKEHKKRVNQPKQPERLV